MPDQNALLDGFAILSRLPEEEIKKRIEWLEGALAAYRTLLIVKTVTNKIPLGMELPQWDSVIPEEPAAATEANTKKRRPSGELRQQITELLEDRPNGLGHREISQLLSVPVASIYNELSKGHHHIYVRVDDKWSLKQHNTPNNDHEKTASR